MPHRSWINESFWIGSFTHNYEKELIHVMIWTFQRYIWEPFRRARLVVLSAYTVYTTYKKYSYSILFAFLIVKQYLNSLTYSRWLNVPTLSCSPELKGKIFFSLEQVLCISTNQVNKISVLLLQDWERPAEIIALTFGLAATIL